MIFRSASVVAATVLVALAACDQDSGVAQTCSDIPANGCPLAEDDSECQDTCCAAAYSCANGQWSFAHSCPGFKSEPDACAGTPEPVAGGDGGAACYDAAAIQLPDGASASGSVDCIDLEPPDCPLSEVLACGSTNAGQCFGCEALFYCLNGAWVIWGNCWDDGGVVPRATP